MNNSSLIKEEEKLIWAKGTQNTKKKSISINKGEGRGGGERAEEEGQEERGGRTEREESETHPRAARAPDSPGERWQDLNQGGRNG